MVSDAVSVEVVTKPPEAATRMTMPQATATATMRGVGTFFFFCVVPPPLLATGFWSPELQLGAFSCGTQLGR